MIKMRGITKFYSAGIMKTYVLRNIDLEIEAGRIRDHHGALRRGEIDPASTSSACSMRLEGEYVFEDHPVHRMSEKSVPSSTRITSASCSRAIT